MIMCVLLCYPVSIHMSQLQATGRPISSLKTILTSCTYYHIICIQKGNGMVLLLVSAALKSKSKQAVRNI